jgi:thioredoxin 1
MNDIAVKPIVVTESEFADKVLRADRPVLVDFWAEWCGPCRALGPIIESLAGEYADRVTVAKLDVDANQNVAMHYGIRSIPTVMLFDKGQIVDTFIGVRPKTDYAAALDSALG